MESKIDWSKAPEGASHYVIGWGFFKLDLAGWFICDDGEKVWRKTPYQSPDNFSWWGNAVERPSPAWSGEGLPPVGMPVEWHSDNQTGWQEVAVLAYHEDDAWIQRKDSTSIIVGNPSNFRPIRTPEQIAAELTDQAIKEIAGIICRDGAFDIDDPEVTESAVALYDAGYRKEQK